MNKNVKRQKSFDFALRIVETYKFLSSEKKKSLSYPVKC